MVACSLACARSAAPALTIFSHSRLASAIRAGNSEKRPTSTAETMQNSVSDGHGRAITSSRIRCDTGEESRANRSFIAVLLWRVPKLRFIERSLHRQSVSSTPPDRMYEQSRPTVICVTGSIRGFRDSRTRATWDSCRKNPRPAQVTQRCARSHCPEAHASAMMQTYGNGFFSGELPRRYWHNKIQDTVIKRDSGKCWRSSR